VVAPQDVIAEFTFEIPKSPDELLREQVEAASGVPPLYAQSPGASDTIIAGVRSFFLSLDTIVRTTEREERRAVVRDFMERNRLSPTSASLDILMDPTTRATLQRSIEQSVRDLYPLGVAPSSLGQGSPRFGSAAHRERSDWCRETRCSHPTASTASPRSDSPIDRRS
jgi:hypothetical protein